MGVTAVLSVAGLVVSILSALENRISWIATFCAFFGDGCRRTQDFTLLRIPVSWWGIAYYAFLTAVVGVDGPWVFWLVMAGVGFELTFLWVMVAMRVFCIFCLFNAAVIAGLAAVVFDPARIWEGATLALLLFIGSKALLEGENRAAMTPPPERDPGEAVAVVEDDVITREELERPLAQKIYRLERKIYRLKRARLDKLIRARLLAKEAARRGVSPERLEKQILREAASENPAGAGEEACENGACPLPAADGDREAPKEEEKAAGVAAEAEKEAALRRFAEKLEQTYTVDIRLPRPLLPRARVPVEGRPFQGPENAPVVVVEFSDPFCPACRQAHETSRNLREALTDRVRWVYKDFPLEKHPGAKTAAAAAHCAGEQGKFWEFQDLLFAADAPVGTDELKQLAASLDLDDAAFEACLAEDRYTDQIEEDRAAGRSVGISATPTFIIDGEMISGAPSEAELREKIEAVLEEKEAQGADGKARG